MIAFVCPVLFTCYFRPSGRRAQSSRSWSALRLYRRRWLTSARGTKPATELHWQEVSIQPLDGMKAFLSTSRAQSLIGNKPNKLFFFFLSFKGQPPKKHVLSSTIPKEFNFCSDNRVKNHTEVSDLSYKVYDFTSQLRKHPSSPVSIGSESRFEHLSGLLSQNL